MGVSKVVRYECDRCDAVEDRTDSLQPPDGWGCVVIIPKPQMSLLDSDTKRNVLCDKCLAEVRKAVEGG